MLKLLQKGVQITLTNLNLPVGWTYPIPIGGLILKGEDDKCVH